MNRSSYTLALPSKGALSHPTSDFLKGCGLNVHKPNERQYIGKISSIPNLDVLFQRVKDVAYKVADNTAQIGITGLDVVCEIADPNIVVIDSQLGYGHCQLVVAVPETWIDVNSIADLTDVATDFREFRQRNIRVATTYPSQTREFLHNRGIHHFTIVRADGAIEAAPTIGYADFVVDLTQTGTTLRENHLKIIDDGVITESQACLIGNRQMLENDKDLLDITRTLLEYIDASRYARDYHHVTVNVQGQTAESVAQAIVSNPITGGLKGPTIAPVFSANGDSSTNGQWYTVTLTLESRHLLDAVEYLRTIGATDIISIPVKYIFQNASKTYSDLVKSLQK